MSYSNLRQNYGGNYNSQGYGPRRNDRFYGGNGGGNNGGYGNRGGGFRPRKKHSGAKFQNGSAKTDKPFITAWNYSRKSGLVSVFIAPYSGTDTHSSKTGNEYQNWMCKIEGKNIAPQHFPVLVNMRTHKATIDHGFGWVVNPSAPNGGYCGTFSKRN